MRQTALFLGSTLATVNLAILGLVADGFGWTVLLTAVGILLLIVGLFRTGGQRGC